MAGTEVRTFQVPGTETVVYGAGALQTLRGAVARQRPSSVAVVRRGSWRDSHVDRVLCELLGDSLAEIVDSPPQHVPLRHALGLADHLRELSVDCIVSFGGGTAIDSVKAAVLCLALDISTPAAFAAAADRPTTTAATSRIRHIAVPTTLSGAEHTALVGVTNEETREKVVLNVPALVPDTVILDPEVTLDTPRELWTSSGIRAVDHAIEGMLSTRRMPFMTALGAEALRALSGNLGRSVAVSGDLDARLACMIGTWLSIFALPNVGVGLSHGIGHQLATEFDLLHGVTSAVMLPWVMEFGAEHTRPQLREIAEALGADTRNLDDVEAAESAIERVRALIATVGVPHRLRDVADDPSAVDRVADNVMRDFAIEASPRPVTRQDVLSLIQHAW